LSNITPQPTVLSTPTVYSRAMGMAPGMRDPMHILVVEDEAIVTMYLETQLEDMGYRVCATVDNARDAITSVKEHRPDLILMDIVIKGAIDGIEAANIIHRTQPIPIIFLTAYSDEKTVGRAAKTGPYGYLTKPFQSHELRAAIEVARYKAGIERHLRESEQWLASTLLCVGEAVIATDVNDKIRFINPAAESLLGWSQAEALGRDAAQVLRLESPPAAQAAQKAHHPARTEPGYNNILLARDNARIPVDDSAAPIRDASGASLGTVRVLRDARERLAALDELKHSEERFRNAFDFAAVGMALVGLDNRFLKVNAAICALLGSSESELIGADQAQFSYQDDKLDEPVLLHDILLGKRSWVQFEKRYRAKSGAAIWALVSVSLVQQSHASPRYPPCYLFQIHNVTERKEAEHRLALLAHFDVLTGLANRAFLSEEIERQIVRARRHQDRLAVVFIDLDHFKQINDSLGHAAGDLLLQAMAEKLKAVVRGSDTVARLGGDEFVLLLPEIHDAAEVLVVVDKVRAECATPVRLSGHEISIGLSLGVSLFPDDAQTSSMLLQYADSALYHAKAEGRNNVQFYHPELSIRLEQRMRLGAGLRVAVAQGEFELYYQPIISLLTHRPIAAEALLRWNHPSMGLLMPDTFIPIIEESGLSVSVGEWVITNACHEAVTWVVDEHGADQGADPLVVAVNVSAQQFKAGSLVRIITKALTDSGLPAHRLCVEITEQLLLQDTEENLVTIAQLKALGVKIAIDDFGVGYSSLSAIRRFGPSELKLDCSLVRNVASDPDDAAIARAVIAMAHTLKLNVVAEGVETLAQEAFLDEQGCDMTQGFHYYRPHSAAEFRAWLVRGGTLGGEC
jgi:diguanylate cyclase (GGDEF)-like protein/PAS domain S-box-containing protein